MIKLEFLLNQKIEKLFLIIWPPIGEIALIDVDISIGFIFENSPDKLCVLSIDKNDMWSPSLHIEDIPKVVFSGNTLNFKIENWMKSIYIDNLDMEYFEVTSDLKFHKIVSNKVKSIELIKVSNIDEPFGLKMLFEDDYILCTPISDGGTIETKFFNKNDNLKNFEKLGKINFELLKL